MDVPARKEQESLEPNEDLLTIDWNGSQYNDIVDGIQASNDEQ